jgi:hypothetical protein
MIYFFKVLIEVIVDLAIQFALDLDELFKRTS